MTRPRFETLAVLGIGLLGGSVALAARRAGVVGRVIGAGRRAAALSAAQAQGLVDAWTTEPEAAVPDADLVILAAPVGALPSLAQRIAGHLKPACFVTDVGSVKGGLVDRLDAVFGPGGHYVGSHPIAGGDVSGWDAARDDLFDDATVVMTPTAHSSADCVEAIAGFWQALGARTRRMDPREHDRIFAAVSHLPHVVAYALAASLADRPDWAQAAGRGLLDTTRIAGSPADVWVDIFRLNRSEILAALERFEGELDTLRRAIEGRDEAALRGCLERAIALRRRIE